MCTATLPGKRMCYSLADSGMIMIQRRAVLATTSLDAQKTALRMPAFAENVLQGANACTGAAPCLPALRPLRRRGRSSAPLMPPPAAPPACRKPLCILLLCTCACIRSFFVVVPADKVHASLH